MRVLHVNNVDLPGRRFNGYDLIAGLASRGVHCLQAVLTKHSDNDAVFSLLTSPGDIDLQHRIGVVEQRHSMNDLLYPWGRQLMQTRQFAEADVVHYHLIHNQMVSLGDYRSLFGAKPSVWTLHDPWPMTGHCIYPGECAGWLDGCGSCASLDALFPLAEDRADALWRLKAQVFGQIDPDIVVASDFMLDMVRRSPLTAHFDRVHRIPFGVEVEAFLPDSERGPSRKALGIPEGDFVILCRATQAEPKGFDYLIDALRIGPPARPTTVLTVDRKDLLDRLPKGYRVKDMGWVQDPATYARILSASDILVMPSTAEAFGLMAVEAMAAGRPVVSFDGTSLAGVTHAPDCGVVVPMANAPALRDAVDRLAASPEEIAARGALGRRLASDVYSHERYLDALSGLYRQVLERNAGTDVSPARRDGPGEAARPLRGVRICLVFEHSLSHYSRILREIEALQEAGALVQLVTSHQDRQPPPPAVVRVVAPLDTTIAGSTLKWRFPRIAHNTLRNGWAALASLARPDWKARRRIAALKRIAPDVDVFWVVDYPSLPTTMAAAERVGAKVVYETVDLVPEYQCFGEGFRAKALEEERKLISRVDGFVTACSGYADYYMDRYGDRELARRPVVVDNMPTHILGEPKPSERPLKALFLGSLMQDRPVLELIDAMALSASGVSLTFQGKNYLGDGPARRIAQLGLQSRVRIVDPCPPDEIVDVAGEYDIGVVALRGADENERCASTAKLFTYMAAGLIVVGSNLPGIAREVEEHGNGVLVDGMAPSGWAESVDRIASLSSDALQAMRLRSLDAANAHSWGLQKAEFIAEFARALGRGTEESRHE